MILRERATASDQDRNFLERVRESGEAGPVAGKRGKRERVDADLSSDSHASRSHSSSDGWLTLAPGKLACPSKMVSLIGGYSYFTSLNRLRREEGGANDNTRLSLYGFVNPRDLSHSKEHQTIKERAISNRKNGGGRSECLNGGNLWWGTANFLW